MVIRKKKYDKMLTLHETIALNVSLLSREIWHAYCLVGLDVLFNLVSEQVKT